MQLEVIQLVIQLVAAKRRSWDYGKGIDYLVGIDHYILTFSSEGPKQRPTSKGLFVEEIKRKGSSVLPVGLHRCHYCVLER
jgi:hypothetical protein